MRALIVLMLLLVANAKAEAMEEMNNESFALKTSKTGIWLSGYTQKKEWGDQHDLMLDYSSILSVNAFRDPDNPRVSITSTEKILDDGRVENRIYWVSFKSIDHLDALLSQIWPGKSVNPVTKHTADDF